MFDYHMHTRVSFDAHETGEAMAKAALANGLKEICFTDHIDYDPLGKMGCMAFDTAIYNAEYDNLEVPGLKIRRGMEFGLLKDNQASFRQYLSQRHYDFVLGSIHYADNEDVYYGPYWEGRTLFQGERQYLEDTLMCVERHEDFDVLAHLTYISKAHNNPCHTPVQLAQHRDVVAEIMKVLIAKGKGMEINTSGVDRCGDFLPSEDYLRLFKDLGGEIVTVGSDAHNAKRVGQYTHRACDILKDIFGYVCTFEDRKPNFHKL